MIKRILLAIVFLLPAMSCALAFIAGIGWLTGDPLLKVLKDLALILFFISSAIGIMFFVVWSTNKALNLLDINKEEF